MDVFLHLENGDFNDRDKIEGSIEFELNSGSGDFILLSKNPISRYQQHLWTKFVKEIKEIKDEKTN